MISTAVCGLIVSFVAFSAVANGQQSKPAQPKEPAAPAHDMASMSMSKSKMTSADKIKNAMSAAPSSISGKAAIMDWPAKEGDPLVKLRDGSNGWTCMPDMPLTEGNDPMCLDAPWMKWMDAYNAKKTPVIDRVGIGYMTAPGGGHDSNTDPFAMKAAPNNQWGLSVPHIMILTPDAAALKNISTDRFNGGPFVMWSGTPYAHIMVPTTTAPAAKPMAK